MFKRKVSSKVRNLVMDLMIRRQTQSNINQSHGGAPSLIRKNITDIETGLSVSYSI